MNNLNKYIFEKLHLNADIKVTTSFDEKIETLKELLEPEYKLKDIIKLLYKWKEKYNYDDIEISTDNKPVFHKFKDEFKKHINVWKKTIEWVNYRNRYHVYDHKKLAYEKQPNSGKNIYLYLGLKDAFLCTYDIDLYIVGIKLET